MNSLHNEALTWIGDGSNRSSLTQKGNVVSIASATSGTPFNARVDSAKAAEEYYLQAKISQLKGNLSMGVISEEGFKPGWKAKGMFYNGNLTNGSAALKTSWGPRFQVGDSLGVRLSPGVDALQVSFFKNGEPLGTGFRLANNKTVFYPCLHVSGSATLEVEVPPALPSIEVPTAQAAGFYGDWKLEKAWDGENELTIPNRPIKFNLSKEGEALQLSFKVANSLNGRAKLLEETETELSIEAGGNFMMTMMMPPPELQPLENFLSSKKMTKLALIASTLMLSGPEMKTEWSRFVRVPETLNSY